MSSQQMYWNMTQGNPPLGVGPMPRVPPPPILGNIDREISSPTLPPDSTTRGRSLSGSSEVELSRCVACPSPGLVPPSAMASHVVSCHRGQAFQCAACRHVGVNTSLLGYQDLKDHIKDAHKVTNDAHMAHAIILPDSLEQWCCLLCAGSMVFLGESLVRDHIASVHGPLWASNTKKWSSSKCRLCSFADPQSLTEHIAAAHPRSEFATFDDDDDENDDEGNVSQPAAVNRSSSHASLSIRSDLFSHDHAGPSVQRSVSPEPTQRVKREKSSSPDIVFEKEVKVKKKSPKGKRTNKSNARKKRERSSSSSSSSSSTDSDSSEDRKRRNKKKKQKELNEFKKKARRWITDIDKYMSPDEDKKVSASSSSPSPLSRNKDQSLQSKDREPTSSPEYRAPGSSPEPPRKESRSTRTELPRAYRSKSRSKSRSSTRNSSVESRDPRHGRGVAVKPLPSRFKQFNIRPPRKTKSRTPPRRFSRTPSKRFSRTPPRRFTRTPPRGFSRTPPRYLRRSPGRFSRTPRRLSPSRSRSPRKALSPGRQSYTRRRSRSKSSLRRRDDLLHCTVCNIDCDTATQFSQHKLGQRHREAEAANNANQASKQSKQPEAVSGKMYCNWCKQASDAQHYHCDDCQVHSTSKVNHEMHLAGKKHSSLSKSKEEVQIEAVFPDEKHCPSCDNTFESMRELEMHVKQVHNFLIICKECKVLKQLPPYAALTCQDLVDHLTNDHHKTNVVATDLKYFGDVKNWKQGYIKCNKCPPLKLGNVGHWFENEVDSAKIKLHFKTFHPKHEFNAISYLTFGCQLCNKTFTSDRMSDWLSHISSHQPFQPDVSQGEDQADVGKQNKPCSWGTTSICPYCCVKTVNTDLQSHIKSQHLQLSFSCKLCPVAERYLYTDYDDILRHLKLKHNGNNPHQNIIFPGDMNNLTNFAWVKCKTCDFKGIGLGKEVRNHLAEKHKGGGLQDFNIFCRICDKDDRAVCNYDDAEEFADHMRIGHDGIIKYLPAKAWLRGPDLGVGV